MVSQCDEERVQRQVRVSASMRISQSSDKPECCSARATISATVSERDDQSEGRGANVTAKECADEQE